jgi:uncharacterized membrane protein YgcG
LTTYTGQERRVRQRQTAERRRTNDDDGCALSPFNPLNPLGLLNPLNPLNPFFVGHAHAGDGLAGPDCGRTVVDDPAPARSENHSYDHSNSHDSGSSYSSSDSSGGGSDGGGD